MKYIALFIATLCALAAPRAMQAPLLFQEDFSAYSPGAQPENGWEMNGGRFVARDGRLIAEGRGSTLACAFAAPDQTEQTIEVTVTPLRRTNRAGWSAAGVTLYSDPGNFWRLSLVASPAGERYAELVEQHNGVWQAQVETGTRLVETPDGVPGFAWEEGRAYRFRLTLTRAGITGEIRDVDGEVRWRKGYEMPAGAAAVRSGRVALAAVDMTAAYDDVAVSSKQVMRRPHGRSAGRYRVAVHAVNGQVPALLAALRRADMDAQPLSGAQMAENAALNPGAFDALLLPDASRCPITAKANLLQFLRGGGDLLVVGGPLFERSVKEAEEAWMRRLLAVPAAQALVALKQEEITRWQRGSNDMKSRADWRVVEDGPSSAREALRVTVANLTGWDTLALPLSGVFANRTDLTIFWAKGDANTPAMLVEWQERDGSRWIANVPLTTQWKRYVLAPEDFSYWPDNPSKNRGGAGDRLDPRNVARLSIGLAMGNAPIPSGRHVYEVAGLSAGRLPEGVEKPDITLPSLEMLSPFYKYYRLPSLHPKTAELRRAAETGNQSGPIISPIIRPRGLGFAANRRGRWIPLAAIVDETGRPCGTRESLYLNLGIPYRGSVWGHLAGVERPGDLPAAVVGLTRRMADGALLVKAGAEYFSYFQGERIPFGAQVANFSPRERALTLRLRVTPLEKGSRYYFTPGIRLAAGQTGQVTLTGKPAAPGRYRAVTELRENGRLLDRIEQEFSVLPVPNAPKSAFVSVRDGSFYAPPLPASGRSSAHRKRPPLASRALKYPAGGPAASRPAGVRSAALSPRPSALRKWYPYGLNYWQTNVAGMDPGDYYMHWLSPAVYDPEVVERDLTTMQALGFTSISIQLGDPAHVRQVNDFVARAARHGIRINLFISGAHPFQTDETLFTRLIREGRFAGNPNIWAYDIAWEHHLGNHAERAGWDREWEAWVIERYGSIAHAEANWGYAIPRDAAGRVTNPSDDQLRTDGPWLKLAAAYERCADDVIRRRYARVIRMLRALDSNHLISARSASQPSWTGWFAYDMLSCGKPFDFSSPEGYGLKPEEAGFTVAYGRYAGNGKPVFWAEFGASLYPYDTTGEKARTQSRLHRGFAQMLLDSGANGLASWWSVGGYRVDEKSDFGIIAPDGTPRAAARELARLAKNATSPRFTKPPSVWVTIDRDQHAAAYEAVYANHKQAYVKAARQGRMVGVRTAGTGTTSANCPLVAVGNVPYDGYNPLKFLNGEINRLELRNARGEWQEMTEGATIEVTAGRPIMARASVGNPGDARWLGGSARGAVRLIGDDRPDARAAGLPRLTFAHPLPPVARYADITVPAFAVSPGISQESEAVFTFEAAGRARFGERRRIVLKPSAR